MTLKTIRCKSSLYLEILRYAAEMLINRHLEKQKLDLISVPLPCVLSQKTGKEEIIFVFGKRKNR